jgi:hypothetical protein
MILNRHSPFFCSSRSILPRFSFTPAARWLFVLWMLATGDGLAQEWAVKMFKVTEHDFGSVARGSKAEFAFELENKYEEDIHVASVQSSCGCTSPTITKQVLKTWEKSQIIAKFNTRSFVGQRNATLTVVIDRPFYAEVQLAVSGYIRSDVVFNPGEINFGDVDQFQPAEVEVTVSYAGRSDWRIMDVRSANEHFEVELKEVTRENNRVDYRMLVRLAADAPAGHIEDQLTLVSDDTRLNLIPLAVHGRVVSPLSVSPASLFLGVVETGKSVSKQLVVRGKQPFKVVNVKCGDKCFKFETSPDQKKLHFIPVTFTAGEKPGKVTQHIEIATDLGAVTHCVASATVTGSRPAEDSESSAD